MRPLLTLLILATALGACGRHNPDRLDDNQLASVAVDKTKSPDERCAAAAAQEAVKRELFRRAAEVRGSNAEAYEKIASFSVLVVEGAAPVAAVAASEAVDCRARGTLRLPPGLHAAGGRTSLSGDLAFSIGADRGATVSLSQGDAIILPLATLTQQRGTTSQPLPPSIPVPLPVVPTAPQSTFGMSPSPKPRAVGPGPSFNCARANARSEMAVCASSGLSALDRSMADHFRFALTRADPDQARALEGTRNRFLAYRDRCGSDACIAQAYRGRIREIDDIIAGR